eukprot:COSAG05_NODE_21290_length_273_cov_0.580460_1_plen_26_part_01
MRVLRLHRPQRLTQADTLFAYTAFSR